MSTCDHKSKAWRETRNDAGVDVLRLVCADCGQPIKRQNAPAKGRDRNDPRRAALEGYDPY